jgi:CDP-diacylglycerol--glycerol-3-phosphate 3-phosphatidyltransferase
VRTPEVGPQDVQRAAADHLAVELGHPELLDGLVEGDEVLLQDDLAGVDVDERLDTWDVGSAGAPDDQRIRLGRSIHTCESIGCRNRYSDSVPGPPDTDPVIPRASVANVANVLTGVRMALVPVFLLALFAGDGHETRWRIIAFVIFAAAVITDRLDGALARSYDLVTEFGKLADPIADKALIGAALIGLSLLGDLPWWVTVLILVREIGVTILRFAVLRRGVIPASRGGKLKALVQAMAIGLFVLPLSGAWMTGAWVFMWAAIVLTVVTGLDYVVSALRDGRRRTATP